MFAVIGGTGFYEVDGFEVVARREIETPFGPPSAALTVCRAPDGGEVLFLPRHGENHQFLPSEVNYRANVWALKAAERGRFSRFRLAAVCAKRYNPAILSARRSILISRAGGANRHFSATAWSRMCRWRSALARSSPNHWRAPPRKKARFCAPTRLSPASKGRGSDRAPKVSFCVIPSAPISSE